MWICLNDSFLSIVSHHENPDLLLVRARNPEHITNAFPGVEVYVRQGSDYGWRADIGRGAVASMLMDRAVTIDYTNFKDSVEDDDLHDCYAAFWHTMYNYQMRVRAFLAKKKPAHKTKLVGAK